MLRLRHLLWLAALPLLAIESLHGSNVQVGTCKPHLQSFSTISAAVSGVPAGSTVQVCPGTYAEQVTITQAVNLMGVSAGTANQALVTVPSGGLLPNTTSMFGESVAAQILVLGAGPVNISNIAVDGTGGDMLCSGNIWVAGIFYGSSSSGTVNRVRASNQVDGLCGVGIWAENADPSNQSVSIQNSSIYNVDSTGIFAGSNAPPTLSIDVRNNAVNASAALAAIQPESVNGQVQNNSLANTLFGLYDTSAISVGTNTIIGSLYGVYLGNGGAARNNAISGASIGVLIGSNGTTVSGNRIMSSTTSGVDLVCYSANLSGNFINDAPVGIDQAPSGPIGANTLSNTATTIAPGSCAVAAAKGASRPMAPRTDTIVREQWHTPATPFGTRTK
jgi:hypothetical protein